MHHRQDIGVGCMLKMNILINVEGYDAALVMYDCYFCVCCWFFCLLVWVCVCFNRSLQRNQPDGKTPINIYFINQLLASYIHF